MVGSVKSVPGGDHPLAHTLSSKHHRWLLDQTDTTPLHLTTALTVKFPQIPVEQWPARLKWGGVYVNGRRVLANQRLFPPCYVEYFEPQGDLDDLARAFPPFDPLNHLVYDDGSLLIVYKPAGLSCMPTREQQRFSLFASLVEHYGTGLHMPSRLDFAAAGLVCVSLTKKGHRPLQQSFEQHQVFKQYLLETPLMSWKRQTATGPIARDPQHPVLRRIAPEGKLAHTEFEHIVSYPNPASGLPPSSILTAQPITGRTHQIRVHAANLGAPIIGDKFYGGRPADDLHLLSYRVKLSHPLTQVMIDERLPDHLLPSWAKPAAWQLTHPVGSDQTKSR